MEIISTILFSIVFFFAGAAIGSFINVVADRVPAKKSIVTPPSHCDNCGRKLTGSELVPVFSYIWLRGKCRGCGASIPVRVLLVELVTGLIYVALLLRFGLGIEFGILCLYSGIFIALSLIDLQHGILPNSIIYPALPVALLIYIFLGPYLGWLDSNIFLWNFGMPYVTFMLNSLLGGAVIFILLLIVVIISRGGMGMGDVKLAGLIGLMTGFPLSLISLFITIIVGGLVAAILLVSRLRKRKDPVPFGPFLCAGALAAMIWGKELLYLYLQSK